MLYALFTSKINITSNNTIFRDTSHRNATTSSSCLLLDFRDIKENSQNAKEVSQLVVTCQVIIICIWCFCIMIDMSPWYSFDIEALRSHAGYNQQQIKKYILTSQRRIFRRMILITLTHKKFFLQLHNSIDRKSVV